MSIVDWQLVASDLERQVAALTKRCESEEDAAFRLKLGLKLQASQAREQKLREALVDTLDFLTRHSNRWDGKAGKHPQAIVESASEALALPTDDSALQARLKEEREKCADLAKEATAYTQFQAIEHYKLAAFIEAAIRRMT